MVKRSNILLMCPADHYGIDAPDPENGHANAFADQGYREYMKDPGAFVAKAQAQWQNLHDIFNRQLGVQIITLSPKAGMVDQVFTADPTLSLVTPSEGDLSQRHATGITLLSQFSNIERTIEVRSSNQAITDHIKNRFIFSHDYPCEGTGDNVYDPFRDVFWSGCVEDAGRHNAKEGRSDKRGHLFLQAATGVPVISLPTKEPFFHIDTAMAPLPNGHIIVYKDGMHPEAFERLKEEGFDKYGMDINEYLILVDKYDAQKYACNVRAVDNTIVMPECSQQLQDQIKSKGYDVITADVSQFLYAGGGVHCLTNNLMETRVVGGVANDPEFDFSP